MGCALHGLTSLISIVHAQISGVDHNGHGLDPVGSAVKGVSELIAGIGWSPPDYGNHDRTDRAPVSLVGSGIETVDVGLRIPDHGAHLKSDDLVCDRYFGAFAYLLVKNRVCGNRGVNTVNDLWPQFDYKTVGPAVGSAELIEKRAHVKQAVGLDCALRIVLQVRPLSVGVCAVRGERHHSLLGDVSSVGGEHKNLIAILEGRGQGVVFRLGGTTG